MKKFIQRTLALVALAFAIALPQAQAGTDRTIEVAQLPKQAQQTLQAHFGSKKIALAKVETGLMSKSYDVIFTDGTKVEFDKRGRWESIDCGREAVPTKLVPQQILKQVRDLYNAQRITEIERDTRGYEVKLSSGMELKFNTKYQIIDIDK